jgi:hypothetical protein
LCDEALSSGSVLSEIPFMGLGPLDDPGENELKNGVVLQFA